MKRLCVVSAFLLVNGSLMAAERIEHSVTVTAQVPTESFYVQPVGDWMNTPQKLTFNPFNQQLDSLSKQVAMKSTIGPIKGYLVYPATMSSGKENINLTIKVGGVELSTTPIDLLNDADAKSGKLVGLNIIPATAPDGGYKPGNYEGIVSMMFESEPPTIPLSET
ncbi:CS1 type fimbrial major subunit [Aeromonas veronii]|uniref:CS1 type fimbrial major subunit n=1 Tax=Aeromonas veronii TaxID=654 RepID=UPI001119E585|nr:CS1 type fimbrial major subunit [Aeromonas veronii]TNI12166.1 adhesin [Aeromonas veronii]